jgi:hypothetical protein
MTTTQAVILVAGGAFAVVDGLWLHRAANRAMFFVPLPLFRRRGMAAREGLRRAKRRYSKQEAVAGAAAMAIGLAALAHL